MDYIQLSFPLPSYDPDLLPGFDTIPCTECGALTPYKNAICWECGVDMGIRE